MARQIFLFDPPERFVVGTVGQPGERTFFLQARGGGRLTSVALEKVQVAALAERLEQLLDEIVRVSGGTAAVPAVAPTELDDNGPLEQPILEEFRVGALSLGWEPETERVVIAASAAVPGEPEQAEDDEDDPFVDDEATDGPDVLRVRVSGAVARAFAKRALSVVAAGRPPCQFCGQPLDPAGHVCARSNGHHPH